MWNYIRTGLQPGRWPVSMGVLALLTVLLATGSLGISAQERRPRPKLIIVHDHPLPELSRTSGNTSATGKSGSDATGAATAFERSLKPSMKAEDAQSGRTIASELAQRSTTGSPRIPPLPQVPSFPSVDRPSPSPDRQPTVQLTGKPASGAKPKKSTLSTRRTSDEPRSGPTPQLLPLDDYSLKNGKLEGQFAEPRAEGLRPLPLRQDVSVEGRKNGAQADRIKTDAVTSGVQPEIFVAGRRKDESANHVTAASVVSAVQPASFSTSEFAEARIGGRPLVVVESAGSLPAYYRTAGADLPAWQIVGLSVAITFLLVLTFLALSLLLLMLRQPSGGNPGSVIRFEVAQPAGGNFMLPFPMMPQPSPTVPPTSQPVGKETPSRGPTRVADFAEDILGAASLGSILGGKHGPHEDNQCEREQSILQQIFEDNVALQEKGA